MADGSINRRAFSRLAYAGLALLFLAAFIAAPFVGGYFLGDRTGHQESYADGYAAGRLDEEEHLAKLLEAEQGLLQPIVLPDDPDCVTLSLISARAGALMAVQSVKALVNGDGT